MRMREHGTSAREMVRIYGLRGIHGLWILLKLCHTLTLAQKCHVKGLNFNLFESLIHMISVRLLRQQTKRYNE